VRGVEDKPGVMLPVISCCTQRHFVFLLQTLKYETENRLFTMR